MSNKLPARSRYFAAPLRLLHWLMALMILSILFLGAGMVTSLTHRPWMIDLHRPLGIAILLLVVVRLAIRLRSGSPPLPADLPRWQALAAHASHGLLYLLMIALPLLGWGMVSAAGDPVSMFGGVILPPIVPADPAWYALLRSAHGLLAWLLFATMSMHLAAAVWHLWGRRDGVFSSIASFSGKEVD